MNLVQLGTALATADLRFVVPSVVVYFVALWIRSVRWRLLLPRDEVPVVTLFRTLAVGFTANNVLPFRLGEVVRAYLLNVWCGVSYGDSVASLVVERVFDALALAALLLLALALTPNPPGLLVLSGLAVGGIFVVGAGLLALAGWRPTLLVGLTRLIARPLPPRAGEALVSVASRFGQALKLIHGGVRLSKVAALSLLAWACELSMFYFLLFAFGIRGTYPQALLAGASGNFATLVPSSPGYVGTFDAAVKAAVAAIGVDPDVATAYALVVHATLLVPVSVLGAIILWRANLSLGRMAKLSRPKAAPPEPLPSTRAA